MNATKIEWVKNPDGSQGYTINPVKGLCPMACPYCYARRMYKRFKWNPTIRYDPRAWLGLGSLRKPSRIFVGSTIELFDDRLSEQYLKWILEVPLEFPQHTFIFLTKQPQNLIKWSPFPDNCWVGVTVTSSDLGQLYEAEYQLEQVTAKVKYLSLEPLLNWDKPCGAVIERGGTKGWLDWLIIGQQTPVSAKTEPKIEWLQEIVEAADKAGVKVFLKDNLKPLIQEAGHSQASWAAKEWVQCKYPVLRQEMPGKEKNQKKE